MKKNFFWYTSISVLVGACLSWGWYHHHIRPLSSIAPSILPAFDPEKKTLEVHVKALSSDECKKLLGHNLPGKGVQPLHFTIQNNSPNEYSISPELVDLVHIDAKKVAEKIKNLALPRSIAFKILGFFFWPFIIPGAIDTIHTFHTYKLLKKDYRAKTMKEEVVPVYSIVNRILFVPENEFKEEFTVTLIEKEKKALEVFSISKVYPEELTQNEETAIG